MINRNASALALIDKIHWDTTLLPMPVDTLEEFKQAEVDRWDSWFHGAGIGEEWGKIKEACKQVGATHAELMRWAQIVELTRLGQYERVAVTPER